MKKQQIRFSTSRDNIRIAYASTGNGPPLVKAANWFSHAEHDVDSPVWRHLYNELSRQHQLLRYDARGCGLSDWTVGEVRFRDWVHDLESVVDAARLDRFPLLGIGPGAAIAVAYAARHPDRVSHLVLHGGFARGRLRRGAPAAREEEARLMTRMAQLGWGQENPAFRQFFHSQMLPGGSAEQYARLNELARISATPENAARFIELGHDIDVAAALAAVRCPTLVLHAIRDGFVPFDEGRQLAAGIPDARFVPLDSGNHLLLEDEPAWARWLQEVRSFLPSGGNRVEKLRSLLSRRETEVLTLIARGCDNAQIAAHLDMAVKTVRNHITHVFAKLEVENRPQAIVLARNAGLGI